MRMRTAAVTILGAALAVSAAVAQDAPTPKVNLSGSYELSDANVGDVSVSVGFKATITNLGENDLSGPVVLRHPNVIQKVWERFGDQSISAGQSITVSANVDVPRSEWDEWQKGGSPALFFYMQNDRGEIKTFRIPLSQTAGSKSD